MRYRAFLSYSHADAHWARWLLRRLESYRLPRRLVGTPGPDGPLPPRLGAVFRDRDELASAGDLSATIREALAESAHLVVVCSPAAAASRWVNAEIEAFQQRAPAGRVLCFVVAGDPASGDCFPPALSAPGPDGRPREPLAADARRAGDGRDRAFLKLVAGLLGIGFDALAQRETQRRQRRLAWVAAASLAGMALTSSLAVSAWLARNDAQRRQAQAEDILGFMLGEMRGKLATVGRLDLMRAVDDKATGYFATLDPRDISDRALEEQARSLTGIGQVRLQEGKHGAAMAAFREAHARSRVLAARQPDNGQRLFDLAQAEYWIGYVAWQQGRLADASRWLTRYRDSALRLAAMDRANFDWQKEVAYGHHNLAVLAESQGHYAQASQAMRAELALFRQWIRQRPADTTLRLEEATIVSWLGSDALREGRLGEAEEAFAAQLATLDHLLQAEPGNAPWRQERLDARLHLASVRALRGRQAATADTVAAAAAEAAALARQDPANASWRTRLGITRWWQAQLATAADPAAATGLARQARDTLEAVHAAKPRDVLAAQWLARTLGLQAQLALQAGRPAEARAALVRARQVLDALPGPDAARVERAGLLVLEGEALRAQEAPDAATRAWRQARALLLADRADPLPFERLDPLVRALAWLGEATAAQPYRQRLQAAGFVPTRPWPATDGLAGR